MSPDHIRIKKGAFRIPERPFFLMNNVSGRLGVFGKKRLVQVDRVVLDPSQGDGHVAEGQGRQSIAGALFHPIKMSFTNLIGKIVEPAGLVIDFACITNVFIVEGTADLGKKGKHLMVEVVQVFPTLFAEIEIILLQTPHV